MVHRRLRRKYRQYTLHTYSQAQLKIAIEEAFREKFIYAGIDDFPCIEYYEGEQTIEIEQQEYEMSQELVEYLRDYKHQLQTKPIPEVNIEAVKLKITPPEKEGEKGYIEIEMELNE